MSHRLLILLALGLIVAGVAVTRADVQIPENRVDLTAAVKSLQQRVEALEAQLNRLEKQNRLSSPAVRLPAMPPFQAPTELPPGARQHKFNGITYYVMPVDGQQAEQGNGRPVMTVRPEPLR